MAQWFSPKNSNALHISQAVNIGYEPFYTVCLFPACYKQPGFSFSSLRYRLHKFRANFSSVVFLRKIVFQTWGPQTRGPATFDVQAFWLLVLLCAGPGRPKVEWSEPHMHRAIKQWMSEGICWWLTCKQGVTLLWNFLLQRSWRKIWVLSGMPNTWSNLSAVDFLLNSFL